MKKIKNRIVDDFWRWIVIYIYLLFYSINEFSFLLEHIPLNWEDFSIWEIQALSDLQLHSQYNYYHLCIYWIYKLIDIFAYPFDTQLS